MFPIYVDAGTAFREPRAAVRRSTRTTPSAPTVARSPCRTPETGGEVYLHFAGVRSAMYVWVNGREVGYSEGSKTPGRVPCHRRSSSGRQPPRGRRLPLQRRELPRGHRLLAHQRDRARRLPVSHPARPHPRLRGARRRRRILLRGDRDAGRSGRSLEPARRGRRPWSRQGSTTRGTARGSRDPRLWTAETPGALRPRADGAGAGRRHARRLSDRRDRRAASYS